MLLFQKNLAVLFSHPCNLKTCAHQVVFIPCVNFVLILYWCSPHSVYQLLAKTLRNIKLLQANSQIGAVLFMLMAGLCLCVTRHISALTDWRMGGRGRGVGGGGGRGRGEEILSRLNRVTWGLTSLTGTHHNVYVYGMCLSLLPGSCMLRPIMHTRENWMIYGGPGFPAVVWFGYRYSSNPVPRQKSCRLSLQTGEECGEGVREAKS